MRLSLVRSARSDRPSLSICPSMVSPPVVWIVRRATLGGAVRGIGDPASGFCATASASAMLPIIERRSVRIPARYQVPPYAGVCREYVGQARRSNLRADWRSARVAVGIRYAGCYPAPHSPYPRVSRQAFKIATAPGVSPCTHMVWTFPSRAKRRAWAEASAGSVISASANFRDRSEPSAS